MKPFNKLGAIFDSINSFFMWFVAILLAIGWLAVCYEVFIRYFFDMATQWTLELNENTLVFITFLGAAWILKEGGHVKIDLFLHWLPKRTQVIVNGMGSILCSVACILIVWYGSQVVWEQYQMDYHDVSILELPQWPLCIVIPIGFFLLFIEFLRDSYKNFKDWRSPQGKIEGNRAGSGI